MQRGTGTSSYSIIFRRKLSSTATFDSLINPTNNKQSISSQVCTAPRRYKCHFNKNVGREPIPKVRDEVFVGHLKSVAILSEAGDEMASCQYNRLLRRTYGLYKELSIQSHTVTTKMSVCETLLPPTVLHCHLHGSNWHITYTKHCKLHNHKMRSNSNGTLLKVRGKRQKRISLDRRSTW